MRKYGKFQALKFRVKNKDGIPGVVKSISKWDKLITKNANRSIKKAVRQRSKIQLKYLKTDHHENI